MSLVTETVRENARARMEREKRPAMNTVRGGFCFRKYHSDDMMSPQTVSVVVYMSLWGKRGPVTRQVGHGHEALTQCRGEEARCQVVADVMYLMLVLDVVQNFDPDSNF